MRIALATCAANRTWPVPPTPADPHPWARDDRPLASALVARGAELSWPVWSDASVDWDRFDLVVPRSTWDYHHRPEAFLDWVDRVPRILNPAEVIRWNADKRYLRELDVPQVPTEWVDSDTDLRAVLRDRGWERAFLKPAVGATAEGTLRFGVGDVDRAQAHVRQWGRPFLVQPYQAEVETLGERSVIVIAGRPTHGVAKIPVPGDYRVQDDYGATDGPHAPTADERALVDRAIAALPAGVVYARVDWLPTADGPRLIELELIEPCLFFRHGPAAADALAGALLRR